MLEALEDKRAEPRNKPPFPGSHGLFGKPTLINNVETFAMVPGILLRGGAWWAAQGKNGASGLKFLAVSGHVRHPGVYEVPWGPPPPNSWHWPAACAMVGLSKPSRLVGPLRGFYRPAWPILRWISVPWQPWARCLAQGLS